MGRSDFQILDTHWDHEPGSDCPVAARQDPPGLDLDPVRWPSSRCDEGSGVLRFMGSHHGAELAHGGHEP